MDKSKFLRIRCPRCSKIHITFGKATTKINCKKCNKRLVKTSGGKTKIQAKVEEVL
ncbi:30S ribosomal protein S27e [Candidatus Pacearchaeota archaeon CG10_big_fil_rev_8_21_14_0_10_35_219]|nr:30S ribosomal protein S27e [Candidatus Pacearchaeota archaeon]OIO42087.1 MAG: 30S ribosomal protein S27e [Candidatus Pacearchaeota archaeon CG1_02_35_32]PIO07239.1 MAG: 30S ribosomal protein S27e [Candidatus Pacearchaeota archaeon CG10_big_fil_rev_8_21_14_0_10_35_219]PIY81192.1 MAG: 30S ribosomal protein S27e [Candidatus Pacearchaeota archaeon CG_4_10_14_0_8_um_filter_35_169]PIZ79443.1 MAG: 30S ribosomal protein S27e [Candidatus Pacearchaeota archaeon CG_4_10_14_0_2_um_filter_35_33]PJA70376